MSEISLISQHPASRKCAAFLLPYSNAVPAPESHRSVASLLSSQSRIPFSGRCSLVKLVPYKASIERHVPAVGAKGQQTAVRKEKTLNRENDHHRQKARLGSKKRRQQHTAAQMAGRTGTGNGVVDHLSRKHQCGSNGHSRKRICCSFKPPGGDNSPEGPVGDSACCFVEFYKFCVYHEGYIRLAITQIPECL